jgi:hypothetical protein
MIPIYSIYKIMSQDIFIVNFFWVDCLQNEITDRSPEKLLIKSGCYIDFLIECYRMLNGVGRMGL